MDTLIHADIFFFVATIGFIILLILLVIALISILRLIRTLNRIVRKVEGNMEVITDEAKQFFLNLRDSRILSWLFGKRHRKKHTEK